jgi:hypothetical protein
MTSRLSREIEQDILVHKTGKGRDWFVANKGDPPKAMRLGKHAPKAQIACSVCGRTKHDKPPMRTWFYTALTGALVCARCALPSGTGSREGSSI